jgi:DNA-binding NtrC family response regulator
LASKVRERWPELKVLVTSGYARNAIVHQVRLDARVELLSKPFTLSQLAAKIRQMLKPTELSRRINHRANNPQGLPARWSFICR